MMTNYYDRSSDRDCPDCGGSMTVVLKREARVFKFWHVCNDQDDCGYETHTQVGPKPSDLLSKDEMAGFEDDEEALYDDRMVGRIATATAEYADENGAT